MDDVERLVREILAAWEQGDFSQQAWAHPEIELVVADGPGAGTYRGLGEMAAMWRDYLVAWEELSMRADEYQRLDDVRMLVRCRWTGHGRTSGLPVAAITSVSASVFEVHDGLVTRLVLYNRAPDELPA